MATTAQETLESVFPHLYPPLEIENSEKINGEEGGGASEAENQANDGEGDHDSKKSGGGGVENAEDGKAEGGDANQEGNDGGVEVDGVQEEEEGGVHGPNEELYQKRIDGVKNKFQEDLSFVDSTNDYLSERAQQAKSSELKALAQNDKDFTPAWRKTGLPKKPSHLRVDRKKLEGGNLLDPKSITEGFLEQRSKEQLRPPRTFEYDDKTIEPHYCAQTRNIAIRTCLAKEKFSNIRGGKATGDSGIYTWHRLPAEEVKKKLEASETRRKKMCQKMSAAQFDVEKKIIDSMKHKLSFLTNPRHSNSLRPTMGRKGKAKPKWGVQQPSCIAPIKSNLTSHADKIFEVEPDVIEFNAYEVGGVYEMNVSLRNVSNVSRRIHLLPPASQYFFLSQLKFPADHGTIAPGMECQFTLRFCPDSLADYHDAFTIDSQAGRIKYPVAARRNPPSLTIPSVISVGPVALGNTRLTKIKFENLGGDGRFRVVPAAHWPDGIMQAPREVAKIDAFRIEPVFMTVGHGEETTLDITFAPTELGSQAVSIFLVCDNCQVMPIEIQGDAQDVDVTVQALDGHPPREGELDNALWFSEVSPGGSKTRTVLIKNETDMAFPFRWNRSRFPLLDELCSENSTRPIELDSKTLLQGTLESFEILPSEGEIHPRESIEFSIAFAPPFLGSFAQWARLMLDKTKSSMGDDPDPDYAPKYAHQAVNLEMLGLGVECPVTLEPCLISISGGITLGQKAVRKLKIDNSGGDAPAIFYFDDLDEEVTVVPCQGVIPPRSAMHVEVKVSGIELGSIERGLVCKVEHGPEILCTVSATVMGPRVRVLMPYLDFGLVRWGHCHSVEVELRNESSSCEARWEIVESSKGGYLSFEPSSGTIPADESTLIKAICRSTDEGKIEGTVKCISVQGGHSQHIRYLAEVIRAKIVMDRSEIDLGLAYLNVPITHQVVMTNVTSLSAEYRWNDEVLGDCDHMRVKMNPSSGVLDAGTSRTIEATFYPAKPCSQSEVIVVGDVVEAEAPAAISVKAEIHDLKVGICFVPKLKYESIKREASRNACDFRKDTTALFPFGEPEYTSDDLCGGGKTSPLIDFGRTVALGDEVEIIMVVKNDGGIEAEVNLHFDEFGAEGLDQSSPYTGLRLPSAESGATFQRSSTKKVPITLSDAHETLSPFTSPLGNTMMTRRRTEHETNGIFRGRGMIVPITPDGAVLKPFGTKRFSMVCKNNMCGEYMDKLHLQVGGLPRITFPVRVGVVGTPLHLQNERALIRGFSQGYNVARLRKDFGQILVGGTLEKTFHVFNLGSVDMDLEWEVLVCDDAEPCVDVTLRPGTSVVSVSVDAKGYPKEGLFEITPKRKMMAAGSSAQFRVRYDASTPEECTAYLVGTQTVKGTQEDVPIRLKMCETGNEAKPIACILSDGFHPHAAAPPVPLYPIRVDLKAATICPHLEPDPQTDASLLIHSTFPPKTHPSYIKTVTYCNKLGSPLTFSISCGDGPFEFMAAAPSVPQDIQDFQGLTGAPKTLENGFILVPPKESVEVTARLQPPKRSERTDYDLDGALTFHYNNGIEQIVPLHATILHPEIQSNVVELDFGAVHVSSPKTLHITVSNPSLVDATWTIVQDDQKPDFTKNNQKSAQFGVFSIEPCGGKLNGRGLLMPRTARVSITLSPTDMDGYEERVRFVCRRGRGCEVVLKGWGTFDERGEHKKELYRI